MNHVVLTYAIRITIVVVLLLAIFGAISVYSTNRHEKEVEQIIVKANGRAKTEFVGPDWLPDLIRRRVNVLERIQSVDFNHVAVPAPHVFADLQSLTHLSEIDFGYTAISDDDLIQLQGLSQLRIIFLDESRVAGPGLIHLSNLPNLERLILRYSPVTDEGLQSAQGLSHLSKLDLNRTRVIGPGLRHLWGLPRLEELDLSHTGIANEGLVHLKGLKHLRVLGLGDTEITDAGIMHLAELTGLRSLNVVRTNITAAGRASLRTALPNTLVNPMP